MIAEIFGEKNIDRIREFYILKFSGDRNWLHR
jgi:hypothetical protein